jgi:hypothetical protein
MSVFFVGAFWFALAVFFAWPNQRLGGVAI